MVDEGHGLGGDVVHGLDRFPRFPRIFFRHGFDECPTLAAAVEGEHALLIFVEPVPRLINELQPLHCAVEIIPCLRLVLLGEGAVEGRFDGFVGQPFRLWDIKTKPLSEHVDSLTGFFVLGRCGAMRGPSCIHRLDGEVVDFLRCRGFALLGVVPHLGSFDVGPTLRLTERCHHRRGRGDVAQIIERLLVDHPVVADLLIAGGVDRISIGLGLQRLLLCRFDRMVLTGGDLEQGHGDGSGVIGLLLGARLKLIDLTQGGAHLPDSPHVERDLGAFDVSLSQLPLGPIFSAAALLFPGDPFQLRVFLLDLLVGGKEARDKFLRFLARDE